MASRSRSRKLRLSRMDAAVDAMMQYGFSEDLVRTHVKQLLKAYGGYDGWIFIEDSAYKELLDSMLRHSEENIQHQKAEEMKFIQNDSSQDRNAEEHVSTNAIGPSSAAGDALNFRVANNVPEIGENTGKDYSHPAKNFACNINHLPPTEEDGKGWKDIQLDQVSDQNEMTGVVSNNMGSCVSQDLPKKNHIGISPPLIPPEPPANSHRPFRAHTDNHGSNTPNEFKVLATGETQVHGRSGKRKSRWDLRPEDP